MNSAEEIRTPANPLPAGRVAVITRTKNRAHLLERACKSVLRQTCEDWIHVIVNDGGSAAAVDAVVDCYRERYRDRVAVIHNSTCVGMQKASNLGIHHSESEFIAIHDDDDSWTSCFMETCVSTLDHYGPDATTQGVVTQSKWIFERILANGSIQEIRRQPYFPFKEVRLFALAAENLFPPIAFIFRRTAFNEIGAFNQEYNEIGDWEFNIRFVSRFEVAVVKESLANYHWRQQLNAGHYANSVVDAVDSHNRHAALMANSRLREALGTEPSGIGIPMAVSRQLKAQDNRIQDLTREIQELKRMAQCLLDRAGYFEQLVADLARWWKIKSALQCIRDYASLKIRQIQHTLQKGPGTSRSPALPGLNGIDILSIDIFDTALRRISRLPTDVFLAMRPCVAAIVPAAAESFFEVRRLAERRARECAQTRGLDDCTLAEIYNEIAKAMKLSETERDHLMQHELATETGLIYPDPDVLALFRKARSRGLRVVFTSDMYLPRSFLEELLAKHGFDKPRVFVSSETRRTKHSGSMYADVLKHAGTEAGRVLHIGDNPASDIHPPTACGLQTYHWIDSGSGTTFFSQAPDYCGPWNWLSCLFAGLARKQALETHGDTDLWRKLGYEFIGPLYLAFVLWVMKTAREDKVSRLFFLSRDGYHLLPIAKKIMAHTGLRFEASYLYASRRLLNIPGLVSELDETALAFLVTPNPCMRVRDFAERVGLSGEDYHVSLTDAGCPDLEHVVTTRDGVFAEPEMGERLKRFFRSISDDILQLAAIERAQVSAYLEDVQFDPACSAIVDLGWQCSSALSLQKIVSAAKEAHTQPIRGYYFGTWKFAAAAVNAGVQIKSLFFHLHDPVHRAELVDGGVELIESFFTAPHPSIAGLRKEGPEWHPVYGEQEIDDEHMARISRAIEAAHKFVDDALPLLPDVEMWDGGADYLEAVMDRVLRRPTPHEASTLGGITLRNTFGVAGPLRSLARVPPDRIQCFDRKAFQAAYDDAYWKRGFLAQLTEREKAKLII